MCYHLHLIFTPNNKKNIKKLNTFTVINFFRKKLDVYLFSLAQN